MASNPLTIRLYLDEAVHEDLADSVRKNGFDCQSAVEAGMRGTTDEEQLEYATSQGPCLLSFNVKDFYALAQAWAQAGRTHAGIMVTNQVGRWALGQLLHRVLAVLQTYTADEMRDAYLLV